MSWPYAYTPYIWPMLVSTVLAVTFGVFSWRQRTRPGALPLALACLFAFLWAAGAALEMAATDAPTRIFWSLFQAAWKLPVATAELWFVLEYAHPGRWANRRTLALSALPPLLTLAFILTNDAHHQAWTGFTQGEYPQPIRGAAIWIAIGYAAVLAAVQLIALLELFLYSPLHRWPVGLILIGQVVERFGFVADISAANPMAPMDAALLASVPAFCLYALALFPFHLFDLLPVARETGFEQMHEAVIVLNTQKRIADLNPAAQKLLRCSARQARGRRLANFPEFAGLAATLNDPSAAPSEIRLWTGDNARQYALYLSPLQDRRGVQLGHLILLHDVTEQKRVQARLLEHQHMEATLQERERLAAELHDSVGQAVAFINLQAQAARQLISRGETETADDHLARLVQVAQSADADIRESILELRSAAALEQGLVAALEQYLRQFSMNYDLRADLVAPDEMKGHALDPQVELQLLRIVQEALANVRKHAHARFVHVSLALKDGCVEAIVEDDGKGFELPGIADVGRHRFGIQLMRERANQVGGNVTIDSAVGKGTRVRVEIPAGSVPPTSWGDRDEGFAGG